MKALKKRIVILGNGRIGRAVAFYFKKILPKSRVILLAKPLPFGGADLLVGALPGQWAEDGLKFALKYGCNLLDISDIDPPFYLSKKQEITKKEITVIPGCGFSPGVVNFIIGNELLRLRSADNVEIKAGSLSPIKNHFPFLWCFEDLILEHRIPSWQLVKKIKTKFPAFASYRKECECGVLAESYFCASGFENVLSKYRVKDFSCRVVRPLGFKVFFDFLCTQGFLEKENFPLTKKILESKKEDNLTLAQITIGKGKTKIIWELKSFSRKMELLNSMQKITASTPAVIGNLLLRGQLKKSGLIFLEDLGLNDEIFNAVLSGLRQQRIFLKRNTHD